MATLAQYFAALEQQRGLPPGTLARMRSVESSNGQAWESPTGAKGDFQFTNRTGRQYGLLTDEDKRDPYKSAMAAANYAKDNMGILSQRLGRAPSSWELFLAHNQGGETAAKMLSNPNVVAGTLTVPRNLSVNGGDPNAPTGLFLNKIQNMFNNTKPTNLGEPFNAPPVAGTQTIPQQGGAPGMAPLQQPPPGKGLLDLIMQDDPVTGADIKGFLGRSQTQQALGGLAKMGQQEQQPSRPPTPLPPLPMMAMDPGVLENRPDMSTLTALMQKRRRVM